MLAQGLEPWGHVVAEDAGAVVPLVGEEHLHDLVPHGRGQRVAAEGRAVRAGRDHVHHVVVRRDRGHGQQAAAERLAHHVDVGHDVLVVARERPPGAGEAGLHLVRHHQHLVAGAQVTHARQEPGRRDQHPALALDRLEQDRGRVLVDRLVQGLEVAIRHHPEAGGVGAIAPPRDVVGGEGHHRGRAAVEVALHGDDVGLVGRDALDVVAPAPGHLDGGLDGLGAGVHRQDHVLAGERGEVAGERPELVAVERPARQGELVQLLVRPGHEPRVAVAEVERGVPRQRVQVAPAVHVGHPRALALGEDDLERVIVVRGIGLDETDLLVGGAHAGAPCCMPEALARRPGLGRGRPDQAVSSVSTRPRVSGSVRTVAALTSSSAMT